MLVEPGHDPDNIHQASSVAADAEGRARDLQSVGVRDHHLRVFKEPYSVAPPLAYPLALARARAASGGFLEDAPNYAFSLFLGLVYVDGEYSGLVLRVEVVLGGGLHDDGGTLGLVDDVLVAPVGHLLGGLRLNKTIGLHHADCVAGVLRARDLPQVEHGSLEIGFGPEEGLSREPTPPYHHLLRQQRENRIPEGVLASRALCVGGWLYGRARSRGE